MGARVEIAALPPAAADTTGGVVDRLAARLAGVRVPLTDRRFWFIQLLVCAVAGLHNTLEAFSATPNIELLCFVPTSLFFMPVVLAAVTFGTRGAVATAIWCTVLTMPNSFLWHGGYERYGEMAQIAFVDVAGLLLGLRVDQERAAYVRVAAVTRSLDLSQLKYRLLFESAREGIVVLDASGRIVESNAAARALAQPPHRDLHLCALSDVFPPEAARQIMEQASDPESGTRAIALGGRGADETWVEPLCTLLGGDPPSTQVVLRNVTQQRRRQIDLETYTAQVHHAQEDERRRIAREIHDETVQSLVMLCRELDDLEEGSIAASPAVAASLHETRDHAEQIVGDLRVLIRGIRPPLLDDLGLAPAVQRLLADLGVHSSIRTNLVVTGAARRAPHAVELAMLRIAQEALHNTERHGAPSHIQIRLKYEYGSVEMEIRDDGRGFVAPPDPSDLAKTGNWGVVGMYERAREAGGELHLASTPGAGTIVTAVFAV